jgi:hypothetical protein
MIALDEKEIGRLLPPKFAVSSQNQPIFLPGRVNQSVTGQVLAIDHIPAHDAQPLRELAEHPVGGEFDLFVGCFHRPLQFLR